MDRSAIPGGPLERSMVNGQISIGGKTHTVSAESLIDKEEFIQEATAKWTKIFQSSNKHENYQKAFEPA